MKLLVMSVTAAALWILAGPEVSHDGVSQPPIGPRSDIAVPGSPVPQVRQSRDQAWTPTDTGTVRPGMTRDQVIAVWGAPLTERTMGTWTYMYYRNGCEVSCGTHDIVFLENGQVVNAIVRGQGHTYAGMSSSPPGRTPEFTPRRPNPR